MEKYETRCSYAPKVAERAGPGAADQACMLLAEAEHGNFFGRHSVVAAS